MLMTEPGSAIASLKSRQSPGLLPPAQPCQLLIRAQTHRGQSNHNWGVPSEAILLASDDFQVLHSLRYPARWQIVNKNRQLV